jgi:hypothetical protein
MRPEALPFGGTAPFATSIETGSFHAFRLAARGLSDLYLNEQMALEATSGQAYRSATRAYSLEETRDAWVLVRSKLWRSFIQGGLPVCVVPNDTFNSLMGSGRAAAEASKYQLFSFEQLLEETEGLGFTQKSQETLRNIYFYWKQSGGKPFKLGYVGIDGHGKVILGVRDTPENGMAYACTEHEAVQVYKHLISTGLIEERIYNVDVSYTISPTGIMDVERLAQSEKSIKVPLQGAKQATAKNPNRTKVFISYSHQDTEFKDRLQVHLKPLIRAGLEVWDDTRIKAGQKWREEIKDAIATAAVAVLLISADFLASEFIASDELPPLLHAAENDGLVVLSVILSPSLFEKTPSLRDYQAVNLISNPVEGMTRHEREGLWVKVAARIQELLQA